uniref:NADH-ubiquinone oxidoreductase chain 2 n=1 Tax=Gehyra brevipalmata TaxID=1127063 RepID=G9HTK4_9SAUR|nr:NADH dehydrogenase subunit 2 [Gehyra brevipalmata]
MNPLIWSLLITSLSTSTIITAASYHWLLAWIGLELNTLSILPIIMKPHHPRATEAATKYFIIQTLAAAMILFASTLNAWKTGHWVISNTENPLLTTTITMAIMLKLGTAPTHLWYPEILQGASLNTALIISTWQKIAPLTMLYMMHNNLPNTLLLLIGLLSALIGGWAGLNQTQMRKILAHSSIAHMGWLLFALSMNEPLATLTLATYIMMTTAMFSSLNMTNTKTITDMGTTWTTSPTMLTLTLLILTSLGGLPPMTGFMPKLLILYSLTTTNLLSLATLLAFASLPSLFFYIRMAHMTTLTTPPTTTNTTHKWRLKTAPPPHLAITATLSLMLLPLTPALWMTI